MHVDGMRGKELLETKDEKEAAGRSEVEISGRWLCSFHWGLRFSQG